MSTILPTCPDPLPADTYASRHRIWWEQCDVLLRQAAIDASASYAEVVSSPQRVPLPTRAELVFDLVKIHPQATILTNAVLVDGCRGIVDAYVAKFPNAVQQA
jgi:hypothetical protein